MKKKTQSVLICMAILLLSMLACTAVQQLIIPATSTAAPTTTLPPTLTATPPPSPSPASTATRTPKPTPPPIACADDSCLDACLTRINGALDTHSFAPIGGDYAGKEANLNLVIYSIENGELGKSTLLYVPEEFKPFQENFEAQLLIWNYASALLPPEQRKWISEYEVFTDGPDNILAWVHTKDTFDRAHWQLGVDIVDAENPVVVTYTLVHEFGHLITLNTDQIPYTDSYSTWSQNPATCAQFSTPDGCTSPDSYLNLFYKKFWRRIFDEWLEAVAEVHVNSAEEFAALVQEFYQKHDEQFVRGYAATNIEEDVAESFVYFVLEPRPRDGSITSQKIKFFYDFPELVDLRKQMIQNMCSYAQQ